MPAMAGEPARSGVGLYPVAAIAALFVAVAIFQLRAPLIHDASWYVHVARGLLAGKHLYTDFIEVNPPLGMWMMVPVVWLADFLRLPADLVFKSLLLVISAGSMALINRYVRQSEALSGTAESVFLVLLAGAMLLLPGPDFGEREHLMALLFAPWLFLRIARSRGAAIPRSESIVIGVLAAVAMALKPQSALAPVLLEGFLLWRSRRVANLFAVENLAAGATVLVYAAVILHDTPAFLSDMVPLGRAAYLPFYGYPAIVQLFNARWFLLLMLGAVLALRHVPLPAREMVQACLFAALGFALSYAIQNKGFTYQALPATVFAMIAVSVAAGAIWSAPSRQVVTVALLFALMAARVVLEPVSYQANDATFRAGISLYAPNAQSIFIASTRLSHGFPLVEDAKLHWSSRLPTQWLAPYVASKWKDGALPDDRFVRLALDTTVTDMIEGRPDIVFIDQGADQIYVPGGTFDYLAFWGNDPRFASFWQAYEQRGTQDSFAIFTKK